MVDGLTSLHDEEWKKGWLVLRPTSGWLENKFDR